MKISSEIRTLNVELVMVSQAKAVYSVLSECPPRPLYPDEGNYDVDLCVLGVALNIWKSGQEAHPIDPAGEIIRKYYCACCR